ncbi:hypothetical protein M422DRAFT_27866 [Sphaerobolus stellatus SS14]|nr:hypothetical protein M422DRAFT_27866 [Sphaerobolus stellatus SS14]
MSKDQAARASLDLTHVLYDPTSHVSLGLALISLSPILLMPAYAVLSVQTREFLVITMWAGQMACEVLNWVLKHIIKQERPIAELGDGYGFPSSHSQWMGYFSTFLIMHVYFRHRFTTTGSWIIDKLVRFLLYVGLIAWAGTVCYSRYYLTYHTVPQILWGLSIGIVCGVGMYTAVGLIPIKYPTSPLGQLKKFILDSSLARWVRIRDGWAIWEDGGREDEWQRWRSHWERAQGSSGIESPARRRGESNKNRKKH